MQNMSSGLAKKMISLVLVSSFCASLASCKKEPEPTVTSEPTVTATPTPTVTPAPAPTETTEETRPAPDFSKEYTYTIYEGRDYEMEITMNVNMDDYITHTAEGDVFELYKLTSDLGWLEKGLYTYDDLIEANEKDPEQTKIGHSNWFQKDFGDYRSVFIICEYIEDIPDNDRRQVSMYSFEYLKNDFTLPYFEDADTNPAHGLVQFHFERHYDECIYFVGGQRSICSWNDAVAIAYSVWSITNSPDDNTVFSAPFEQFRSPNSGLIWLQ